MLTGLSPSQVSPVREIALIAPRPVLLIHGDSDEDIPVTNSKGLLQAAGPTDDLWIVPGAKHVKAFSVAGTNYTSRIIKFLDNLE